MAQQFFFPCKKCQHSIRLETKNAGQQINCSNCGESFEAPKLRELKMLAQAPNLEEQKFTAGAPNRLKSWLFVMGLILAFICGVASWGLYQYASTLIVKRQDPGQMIREMEANFDTYSPAELWATWTSFSANKEIPDWDLVSWGAIDAKGRTFRITAYYIMGVGGFGLLLSFVSLFLGGGKQRR
jgi:hypothetical protein